MSCRCTCCLHVEESKRQKVKSIDTKETTQTYKSSMYTQGNTTQTVTTQTVTQHWHSHTTLTQSHTTWTHKVTHKQTCYLNRPTCRFSGEPLPTAHTHTSTCTLTHRLSQGEALSDSSLSSSFPLAALTVCVPAPHNLLCTATISMTMNGIQPLDHRETHTQEWMDLHGGRTKPEPESRLGNPDSPIPSLYNSDGCSCCWLVDATEWWLYHIKSAYC